MAWAELLPHLMDFWRLVCADLEPRQRAGQLKQWLNLMRRRFPEAERAYQQVRTMTDQAAITLWLQALPQQTVRRQWPQQPEHEPQRQTGVGLGVAVRQVAAFGACQRSGWSGLCVTCQASAPRACSIRSVTRPDRSLLRMSKAISVFCR